MDFPSISNSVFDILSEYKQTAPMSGSSLENVPIEVDILKPIFTKKSDLKTISWKEVDVTTPHVLANVKFYYPVPINIRTNEPPTTAIIHFKTELNLCHRRFVITKEMCHCLIDNSDEFRVLSTSTLTKLIEGLASSMPINGDLRLASEHLAEMMAIEILFPLEMRLSHIDQYRDGKISDNNLALRYRIPVEYAEIGMYQSYIDKFSSKRTKLITLDK
jgi:hypothetical protein